MADLVTRIIAEDKQFNDKIERSKRQTKQFSEIGKAASGMMMKMAGAFGVAASATEAFRKIIDSTQSNTDKFNSAMDQAKAGVDLFFDSIAVGDFGNFFKGLDGAIDRARELYDVMDTLGDMQAGWSDIENEYRTKINENIAAIYDTNTPLADRKKLMDENKQYIALLEKKSRNIVAQTAEAVVATARREAQMDNVTESDVKRYLQEISMHDDPQFYDYLKRRSDLEKQSKETAGATVSGNWGTTTISNPTEAAVIAERQLEALKANNAEMEKYYRINELINDTKRTEIVQLRAQGRAIDNDISKLKRQQATVERRYGKYGGKGAGEGDTTTILPAGSIAELEGQVKEAQQLLLNATTDEARRAADLLIKTLEAKKAFIQIGFKYPAGVGGITPGSKLANVSSKVDIPDIDMSEALHTPEVKTYSDYLMEASRNNEALTQSIYGVGDAMRGLSGIVGDGAGQWLQWGANVLDTVGRSLPALTALANANAAVAASGAAASVAATPIVGPILAAGAVLSIMGALMNLPKFATGGIVGGNSYTGDNVLARVNSGELILNAAQQQNLAGALGAGIGGSLELKVKGKDLVTVLDQQAIMKGRR